jgi:acyl phosphate:glycerol-3-phosphate acyltransferase
MLGLLAILIAYIVGAIPFGYLVVKFTTGGDVRESGSGNIGATNVLRTTGRGPAALTLALDIAKGFLAVWLAAWLTDGSPEWTALAALAVMAGHAFPVFLKFQGGKAVATFVGAFLYVAPVPLLAALLIFLITVYWTRYISAGSILAAGSFPLGVWLIDHPPLVVFLASLVAAGFIVYRHKSNLERLRQGTEHVFRWKTVQGGGARAARHVR